MVFKDLCGLLLWMKVASALEGLNIRCFSVAEVDIHGGMAER